MCDSSDSSSVLDSSEDDCEDKGKSYDSSSDQDVSGKSNVKRMSNRKNEETSSFSSTLEENGMWRRGPHFSMLHKNDIENILKSCKTESSAETFQLPSFEKSGSKFAKFNVSKSVLNDKLKWSRKEKGKKVIKPRKRTVIINDSTYIIKNCASPVSNNFKKYTIESATDENLLIVIYVSSAPRHSYTDLNDMRNGRISDDVNQQIRSALVGKSVRSAFEELKKQIPNLKEKQVRNMSRAVPECVKRNRGQMPVTVPESLAQLQTKIKGSYFNSKGKDYQFAYIDKETLSVYLKSLPTRIHVRDFREKLKGSEEWSLDEVNSFIGVHSKAANSGTIAGMTGQMQIDCTFDLSDCVVTIISVDISGFITRTSGKTRHSCIGFMLSSSKSLSCHQFFARIIHEEILELDPKMLKAIPVSITDGENALLSYTSGDYFIDTVSLRCSVHRRDNLTRENKCITEEEIRKVFGVTKDDGALIGGVFDTMNIQEFEKRVENAELSKEIETWILQRKDDLFRTHSLYSRLQSGIIMQYVTTNRIENFNSRIKNHFTKTVNGKKCAEKLRKIVEDEKSHMACSIIDGDDPLIEYSWYRNCENSSGFDRSKILQKAGFLKSSISHVLKIPTTVWNNCDQEKIKINDIFSIEVTPVDGEKYLVQKSKKSDEAVTVLVNDGGGLICKNSKCRDHPTIVCIHILATASKLPASMRSKCWTKLEQSISNETDKQFARRNNSGKDSKRYQKRKYTVHSKNNQDRTLKRIYQLSDCRTNNSSFSGADMLDSDDNKQGLSESKNYVTNETKNQSKKKAKKHQEKHQTCKSSFGSDEEQFPASSTELLLSSPNCAHTPDLLTGETSSKLTASPDITLTSEPRGEDMTTSEIAPFSGDDYDHLDCQTSTITDARISSDSDESECETFRRLNQYLKKGTISKTPKNVNKKEQKIAGQGGPQRRATIPKLKSYNEDDEIKRITRKSVTNKNSKNIIPNSSLDVQQQEAGKIQEITNKITRTMRTRRAPNKNYQKD